MQSLPLPAALAATGQVCSDGSAFGCPPLPQVWREPTAGCSFGAHFHYGEKIKHPRVGWKRVWGFHRERRWSSSEKAWEKQRMWSRKKEKKEGKKKKSMNSGKSVPWLQRAAHKTSISGPVTSFISFPLRHRLIMYIDWRRGCWDLQWKIREMHFGFLLPLPAFVDGLAWVFAQVASLGLIWWLS